MNKLPYRVDEPAAKVDAMLDEHQRRKIEAVDLFRKPHLTWHEYQWCLQLSSKYARQQFLRLKREDDPVQTRLFLASVEMERSLIASNALRNKPAADFPAHQKPQKQSRLQRLINFFKRATRANYTT